MNRLTAAHWFWLSADLVIWTVALARIAGSLS